MKVFVTGATGLIGSRLVERLRERKDDVVALVRDRSKAGAKLGDRAEFVEGDVTRAGSWMEAVNGCAAVVHLAGAPIFGQRWSRTYKDEIRSSRITGTQNVVQAIAQAADRPSVLISGSAIGYYGPHEAEEITESSPPGHDFLADVCVEWEAAAWEASRYIPRVVLVRTGVVLATEDGALPTMLPPFKAGLGAPVGSGQQFFSWIHLDDEVGIILWALDTPEVSGPLNATAPNPVSNAEFSRALAAALHRPFWSVLKVPAAVLRLRLGQVAEVVTTGQRVLPRVAQEHGYAFRFAAVRPALDNLVGTNP